MDVQHESEENTVASFSWGFLLSSLYVASHWDVNIDDLPVLGDMTSYINPDFYNFRVEADYYMGSLYRWSGICHYKCATNVIFRTENGTQSVIYNWAMVGCNSGTFALYTVDKQTGERQMIYEFEDFTVGGSCIPLGIIDRNGLPKQGETLEMPYYPY